MRSGWLPWRPRLGPRHIHAPPSASPTASSLLPGCRSLNTPARGGSRMGGLRLATFIALLRGINVGGTGLLPMSELVALCSGLDFQAIRTYIQSGNVIFQSTLSEDAVRSCLEKTLQAKMGKKIAVMVRTPAEMKLILAANPFPHNEPAKVNVAFLCDPPP